ncbi:hypothetical protein Fcan01_11576 [Folsomia candida]|uniref:Uncharacterized protein n=1 Tax=Folsomia candida TaxID=158441 RepID=A0A226EBA9_FOLCA|nr:hypothetical protein Fcan01_11576 [Folsomia candida]
MFGRHHKFPSTHGRDFGRHASHILIEVMLRLFHGQDQIRKTGKLLTAVEDAEANEYHTLSDQQNSKLDSAVPAGSTKIVSTTSKTSGGTDDLHVVFHQLQGVVQVCELVVTKLFATADTVCKTAAGGNVMEQQSPLIPIDYNETDRLLETLSTCRKVAFLDTKENIASILPFLNDNENRVKYLAGEDSFCRIIRGWQIFPIRGNYAEKRLKINNVWNILPLEILYELVLSPDEKSTPLNWISFRGYSTELKTYFKKFYFFTFPQCLIKSLEITPNQLSPAKTIAKTGEGQHAASDTFQSPNPNGWFPLEFHGFVRILGFSAFDMAGALNNLESTFHSLVNTQLSQTVQPLLLFLFLHENYSCEYYSQIQTLYVKIMSEFSRDLISSGLWDCLERFVSVYSTTSILPFNFDVTKKHLNMVGLTRRKNVALKICHWSLPLVTLAAMSSLFYMIYYPRTGDEGIQMAKMFIATCILTLLPCFTAVSFLIAFKPSDICSMINPIASFGDREFLKSVKLPITISCSVNFCRLISTTSCVEACHNL